MPKINNALKYNITIIDDDAYIRQILINTVRRLEKSLNISLNIYSSPNGVEGLGTIISSNPNIAIVDLTLPKYSGNEIFALLNENKLQESKFIFISDDPLHKDLIPDDHYLSIKVTMISLNKLLQHVLCF